MNQRQSSKKKSDQEFRDEFKNIFGFDLPTDEEAEKKSGHPFRRWPEFAICMRTPDEMRPWERMLLQFREIPQEYFQKKRDLALIAIRNHLRKYGGEAPQYRYNHISRKIEKALNQAMPQLLNVSFLGDKLPSFQEKWLYNIPRLLPCTPKTVNILPFLIASYIISIVEASGSEFDPFDSDRYGEYAGWITIFQSIPAQRKEDPIANSETYIWTLSQKFSQDFCKEYEQFFNYGTSPHPLKQARRGPKGKNNFPSEELVAINRVRAWEYYRCFVTLCNACAKVFCSKANKVNITLSMAMFCSIWDWNCPEPESSMLFDVPQYSLEDVEKDTQYNQIISFALSKYPGDAETLENEVRYLGNLYSMTRDDQKAVTDAYKFEATIKQIEKRQKKIVANSHKK